MLPARSSHRGACVAMSARRTKAEIECALKRYRDQYRDTGEYASERVVKADFAVKVLEWVLGERKRAPDAQWGDRGL